MPLLVLALCASFPRTRGAADWSPATDASVSVIEKML
jgi:hypothetical protein